jgi:F-type H+-transporting ATPase subunit b
MAFLLALAAVEEGGGGGALTDINTGLIVWTVVLFAVFAFVMGRYAWKPLLTIVEEREKSIRDAVSGADSANAEAAALLAKHREMVQEAGREREEILKRALKEAEEVRSEIESRARAESETTLKRAKEQIEREKEQAILELRTKVADLAIEAAAKIVHSSLTPEAQRKLVTEFVDGLPR